MIYTFPTVTVTPKGEAFIKDGHVWVYADEITGISSEPCDGELVTVLSSKERFLGTGFYNTHSKIRVRIVSKNANDKLDADFWERRLRWAIEYRRAVMSDEDFRSCRLIFGEADGFPGFTVDKFENVLVTQVLSLGIEAIKDMLYSTLVHLLRTEFHVEIDTLYERNDVAIRELEGMKQFTGYWSTSACPMITQGNGKVMIRENGVCYEVDYVNGQKTGFFLDQKYNRRSIHTLAKGRRVLDCFTHTGSFALNAAIAGAKHVTAVDISADAIELCRKNAIWNRLSERMDFICADVFELLTSMAQDGKCDYDLIILDPPAFTKSRETVKNAYRGYKEINLKAMKLLKRGSYLATCSCSHFMREDLFVKMLNEASRDAGVTLRQIEARKQACDHPILLNVPETDYLKFFIFQVV